MAPADRLAGTVPPRLVAAGRRRVPETAAIERIRNAVTEDRGEHVEPSFGPGRYRRHAREGLAWKRRHEDGFRDGACPCHPGQAVRYLFLDDLDEQTERIAGTAIGGALRSLYLNGW